VRGVADGREGRLDGHLQAELPAGHLIGVERVDDARGDLVAAVDELADTGAKAAFVTDQFTLRPE
jgi:hypothetical protein